MADVRLERDLRDLLTVELDAVHGPHPRWADAPVARRIGRTSIQRRRPVFAAAAVIAAAVALSVVLAVVVLPWAGQPVATTPATAVPTNEPLPLTVSPSASPTLGEIPLGRVAISTQAGTPALAVRVIALPSSAGEAVIRIDLRVIGPVTEPVGASRFVVIHDGRQDPLPAAESVATDPLAIAAGSGVGTTVYAEFSIPVSDAEWADLGYLGIPGSTAFTYPLHRPANDFVPGSCPTLADYAAASAIPTIVPAIPSFDPVSPVAPPTTGSIALGATGILAAPDGTPGALVRVSNARLCDRLPDLRPDSELGRGAMLLLADVEIRVLVDGTLPDFLPGTNYVDAAYAGWNVLSPPRPGTWYPDAFWQTTLDTGAGYAFHGTMLWVVPGGDGQLAVRVLDRANRPQFSYKVRIGTVAPGPSLASAAATPQPTVTAIRATFPLDWPVVIPLGGVTARVQVGDVAQVARYTGLAPSTPGDLFLEAAFWPLGATGTYAWDPRQWVVVGPDGAEMAHVAPGPALPQGWPLFRIPDAPVTVQPDTPWPLFVVTEVPPTGQVTLEYRPNGGPAVATWVLRGR